MPEEPRPTSDDPGIAVRPPVPPDADPATIAGPPRDGSAFAPEGGRAEPPTEEGAVTPAAPVLPGTDRGAASSADGRPPAVPPGPGQRAADQPAASAPTRAGIVAVLGAPNAGKSTLVNRLAGAKVSIVSAKPQTTRFRIRAVLMVGRSQVVLTDTPGIFAPRRRLDRAMVAAAWGGAQDADMALLVVDARAGITDKVRAILDRLKQRPPRLWLVLNKTDLLDTKRLLPLTAELNAALPFEETFMVSAEKGDGVDRLTTLLGAAVPEGPWLFPEDELSDLNERMLCAEMVREQILRQTHEEVPHHATVETESWAERKDGSVRVDCTIYVGRATQKAILIGDKGSRIREIGRRAREELTRLLERPVHLFLNVKDRPGWDEERGRLRALGLEDLD